MLETVFDFINFGPAGAADAGNTVQQAQTAPTGGGGFGGLLFFLIIIILMWVMLFLPQRRQEKRHKEMLSALKKGDKIVTSSGIIGKIISITNERIRISTADKTEIDITKNAVAGVLSKSDRPEATPEETETEAETEDKK
ncbi:preprotein translocase subunit YajC [Petrotoga olearia]|uniref:Membrane protein n=2 Tax=Petrotoga olearia TaxID=156203 RepID=A0A2K1P0V4_9BACT|nr:preprotein translocase subunit YajC [Petrotoga olearia]KUK16365.1 MAG: Preprotein translocase, YajC subunit [Petrotoga mobilis]PNR96411.1 membrane protein [Petrotoga olearia DSM 13574]RMA76523.1 preprotein translocase subunit YajC [Petrotoga olearia]HBT51497.1 preprotein translocase subunit YajC [Petrotoga sp.]